MGNRLDNKIAIVTGSARGIGKAIAKLFMQEGATVIATDKDVEELQKTAKELSLIKNGKIVTYEVDITNKLHIESVVKKTIEQFNRIDILINNAGKNVFEDPMSISSEQWELCYNLNLKGSWNCSQTVLPFFIKQQYGNVVNIASVHGHKIIKDCFPYPVFKHGLIGLTNSLAIQYASQNIRFNSISPGLILTPAIEDSFNASPNPEAEKKAQEDILPCKRIGTPEEVAHTALFLASDEARFINATDILIDGGRSKVYHD
ncbi:SDR family oxidoreductase [Tenacibaculum aestuariivivum]|uniref:SDR family oxidoreductase n=1 Tax=Tenacibaculum aestuariivivum TaxID=2006131 RepID=UPI003AB4E35D